VDGYFGAEESLVTTQDSASVDDIVQGLASSRVSAASKSSVTDNPKATTVAGELVGQDKIFDSKTRYIGKIGKQDTLSDEIARLWVRQVPNFILAYHDDSLFSNVQIKSVTTEVQDWETSNCKILGQLAVLLDRIMETVRAEPTKKIEVCHLKGAITVLQCRAQFPDAGEAPSAKTRALWKTARSSKRGEVVGTEINDAQDGQKEDYGACTLDCGYCGRCAAVETQSDHTSD
jgi:hypothetical protein